MKIATLFLVLISFNAVVHSREQSTHLSLEYLLNIDVTRHPIMQEAQAELDLYQALVQEEKSKTDFSADLTAQAQIIEPSDEALDSSRQDHKLWLSLNKPISDFGRTKNKLRQAQLNYEGNQFDFIDKLNHLRINVVKLFFAVILADLRFARDNEFMAVAYVQFDRGMARHELGQLSDVDLLELENRFQQYRQQYYNSQAMQRYTRSQLSVNLSLPDQLVNDIEAPTFSLYLTKLPDVEMLQKKALQQNTTLQSMRTRLQAAEHRIVAAQAERHPKLFSSMQLATYSRDSGGYDPWRASVTLQVPLWAGSTVKATTAHYRAESWRLKANLKSMESAISQSVLEHRLALDTLAVRREALQKKAEYRELVFDRNQALYEMEVQSDIGDSMAQMSSVKLQLTQVETDLYLTWLRLQALIGVDMSISRDLM